MGVRPIGSLGISGSQLSRQSVEAVSTLVAIAIERARAVEQLGPNRSGTPRRAAEIGAARFDHARFPDAADFDEGGGDQLAEFATVADAAQAHELLTIVE